MPFADLQREILDEDMCARCGACVAICPFDWLAVGDDGSPVTTIEPAAMRCGECSLCLQACPGRDPATPQSERRIFGRTRTSQERWAGIHRQSLNFKSAEPRIQSKAAAGGAGTTLLIAALRSGLVDGVIVIGRDANRPWVPAAIITGDEDEVMHCTQTSYCITPNLHLLKKPGFARVAVVGVPCEIQAIQKMKNLNPISAVAEKIALTLEIACASSTTLAGTAFLIEQRLGLALEDVREMRYRDGEYPGAFAVVTNDGQRRSLPFFELVDEFKRFKTHRCLTCADWWSGLADVSICDGDPNIYASSQGGTKPPRQSTVMVRTEAGEAVVGLAVEMGLAAVSPMKFEAADNLGLQRKRFRYASFAESIPDRVPTAPVDYEETQTLLTDTEVIERMSHHAAIGQERGRELSAPRVDGALLISACPAAPEEIVWQPPGDKSVSLRLVFAAALADGTSTIRNALRSDDIENCLAVLRQLGVDIWEAADNSLVISGRGLRGLAASGATLDVGNSATAARILIGLLAASSGTFRVTGNELLRQRPMEWVVEPLRRAGADITYECEQGRLPVSIRGSRIGAIRHSVEILSAQPTSALLFAGLQSSGPTEINRPVRARDHTERLLRNLGVELEETEQLIRLSPPRRLAPFDVAAPGDVSAAALPVACTVISPFRRRLVVERVGINETRTGFVRALRTMGAAIEIEADGMEGGEPIGRIVVESGRRLHGVTISGAAFVQSMIDELPLLAAVATRARGRTVISDAGELTDKDTDRIATTVRTLGAFGAKIEGCDDGFVIEESRMSSPKRLALPPDHRVIFAAMATASALAEPTTMTGWERVSVSFPDCLDIISRLATVERRHGTR